jgi:hydrogenase nickel incorporation protein HypA/HybF
MHEASVASEILHIVQQAAAAGGVDKVTTITLQIGAFSCIQPDLLQFAFDVISRNTVAQDAKLQIISMPGKAWCNHCQQEYEITFTQRACPVCGIVSREIVGGKEAVVQSIEGE